ncbi:Uncharacterized protein HZ326_15473 [Fusarium oxysporum f. sp. albedinis]|nr:Uncharacterized protein HZ326_15473 [Fusarium oxysporum f. sp. albedinis]
MMSIWLATLHRNTAEMSGEFFSHFRQAQGTRKKPEQSFPPSPRRQHVIDHIRGYERSTRQNDRRGIPCAFRSGKLHPLRCIFVKKVMRDDSSQQRI